MVGDLSEGIVLEFLQLGVDTPTAELEDYPCVFLLRGGLLVPYQDSEYVQQVLCVHIELYFPQLWRGTAIEPLVVDDIRLIVLWFEDLIPEFYVGEEEVQTAEGFFILPALILSEGEGDIPNSLFLHQFAK